MSTTEPSRGQWSSKIGFILAAAGSAIGLGSIWRFPYMTGENGGAIFVLLYLLAAILIALPMMWNEIGFGRLTQRNMIGGILKVRSKTWWVLPGIMGVLISFVVLGYYSVISGWTIGYIYISLTRTQMDFGYFIANLYYVIPLFALFMLLTIWVVQAGVEKGIERWCNILMPTLFVLCIVIAVRSLTLPGAMAGVKYYLVPDMSKLTADVVLAAVGQAFFSLSVGAGLMVVYGSYMQKEQSIVSASLAVTLATAGVALLAGFMIFPAVFAFGKSPAGGPTLTFQVLPQVFQIMPGGPLVGAGFFLLLLVAALTSSISLLEVPVAYFVDEKGWSRKFAAWTVGIMAFVVGIPSALACGASPWFSNLHFLGQTGFLNIADYIFGTLGFVTAGLIFCLFVGWRMDISRMVDELTNGAPYFKKQCLGISLAHVWVFFIRIVCPCVLLVLLVTRIVTAK